MISDSSTVPYLAELTACPTCGSNLVFIENYIGTIERTVRSLVFEETQGEPDGYIATVASEPITDELVEIVSQKVRCERIECNFSTHPQSTLDVAYSG